jgi:quinol monooxygenase YgiN
MILIDVKLEIDAGKEQKFVALMEATMAASQAETGSIEYRFSADITQPGIFYLFELWKDESALMEHFTTLAFHNFITTLPELGKLVSSVARQGDLSAYEIKR